MLYVERLLLSQFIKCCGSIDGPSTIVINPCSSHSSIGALTLTFSKKPFRTKLWLNHIYLSSFLNNKPILAKSLILA